jgi:hypothetical protein
MCWPYFETQEDRTNKKIPYWRAVDCESRHGWYGHKAHTYSQLTSRSAQRHT